MSKVGSPENPLRVAIIGAGPAGFYTASSLLKRKDLCVQTDMFDGLPSPFGLVRTGVAPDHQKYKSVIRAYDKRAQTPDYRFYGCVEFGRHIELPDLKEHYHQVVFTTGAQTDRSMGIPGEDLAGSHSATDFVAWYNGHPDFVDYQFDFSQTRAAVVGLGNVALDVARILCRTKAELLRTDMADYAIEALAKSNVKEVYILGRRGPAQAAFSTPEIRELSELAAADVEVRSDEAQLDACSREELAKSKNKERKKNVVAIQKFADAQPTGKSRKLAIRFLVSPTKIIGSESGRVEAVEMVRNEVFQSEDGSVRPRATDRFETLPVGLVFRSVGYRGVSLPGIPFNENWGTIENEKGRIVEGASRQPLSGLYTAGWIKRGPTGVIGTNKKDARETVVCMMEDLQAERMLTPAKPQREAAEELVKQRQPQFISYDDWSVLDAEEVARGQESGRPRVKFTSVAEMLTVLGR